MGTMTASIAHEINQPLGAIAMNAEAALLLLSRPEPDLEKVRAELQSVVEDAHRASQVIASVRAMFGKDQGERSALNLNELVRQILAVAHGEIERNLVSVQIDLIDRLPQILGDRIALQQVFLNLIMNAVDAMSSVTDRERVLTIRSRICKSDRVLITLENSGKGIDPSHIDRIFDAFFTTKSNGMGMGLSICRSIIEDHGGRLSAKASYPHGSVFKINLPTVASGRES